MLKKIKIFISLSTFLIVLFLLKGCGYHFRYQVSLKNCFKPYSVLASQLASQPYVDQTNFKYKIYLRENGYHYMVSTFDLPLPSEKPKLIKGEINFIGDIELNIPDWGQAYIGGSSVALYLPVINQNKMGVFSALDMKRGKAPFPQHIEAHCKKEILKICNGRKCRFKQNIKSLKT